jgi:hypothetical protein
MIIAFSTTDSKPTPTLSKPNSRRIKNLELKEMHVVTRKIKPIWPISKRNTLNRPKF